MDKPLFDLDVPGMQAEVNSYKPGNGLAWSTLFPLKYTPKFDLKGIEGNEGIPVSADRVAFNTRAPLKTRKTVGSWNGKLGKIAISKQKGEIEINEYKDLKVVAASNTEDKATARYLVDLVYDDIKACNDGMDYKIEIDALRIASHGKQTFPASIEGDMATQDEINFNIPTENFSGVAKKWSEADADGIKNIVDAQKAIVKKGLKKPLYAILEQAAFDNLLLQPATARRMFPAQASSGIVTADMMTIDSVNVYMKKKGYPQFLVLDSYATIEKKDGTQETIKPFAENVVVLSPVPQLGWTYFKPVPMLENTDALQVQGKFAKTTVYSEPNPMLEVTMAEAYVQCGLINRASLAFINTEYPTWNEGETTPVG